MKPIFYAIIGATCLSCVGGCCDIFPSSSTRDSEHIAPSGYTPIDPLPITDSETDSAKVLAMLPDTTSRMAIGSFDSGASLTYGPARLSAAGHSYEVIVDYIQFTTKSIGFIEKDGTIWRSADGETSNYIVPVYIGVGVRLLARLHAEESGLDVANLVAIGFAADAKKLNGSLVIQTMGLSGPDVAAAQTISSSINSATIASALITIGTIKSKIYDRNMRITPRVVAISNTLPEAAAYKVSTIVPLILANRSFLTLGDDLPSPGESLLQSGILKSSKAEYAAAIDEFSKAAGYLPKDYRVYYQRASAEQAMHNIPNAIADYTRAIDLSPQLAIAFEQRAYLYYNSRSWTNALYDFRKVIELTPGQHDYDRLRVSLVRSRLGEREAAKKELIEFLDTRATTNASDAWYRTIARFLTGQITIDELLKATECEDEKVNRERSCEAFFYIGTDRLFESDIANAKIYFRKCVDTNVKAYTEYASAAAELDHL